MKKRQREPKRHANIRLHKSKRKDSACSSTNSKNAEDICNKTDNYVICVCNHNEKINLPSVRKSLHTYIFKPLFEKFKTDVLDQIENIVLKNMHLYSDCVEDEVFSIINALILTYIKEAIISHYKMPNYLELTQNIIFHKNEPIKNLFKKNCKQDSEITIVSYFDLARLNDNFLLHFTHVYTLFDENLELETNLLKVFKERQTLELARNEINALEYINNNLRGFIREDQEILVVDLEERNFLLKENTVDCLFWILYKKIKETKIKKVSVYIKMEEFVDVFEYFKWFVSPISRFYEKIEQNMRQFYLFKHALNKQINKVVKSQAIIAIQKHCQKKKKIITPVFISSTYLNVRHDITRLILSNFSDDAMKCDAFRIIESSFIMASTHLQKIFYELSN